METITKAARADYRHKKQSGGAGQFGEVHLIIEPYTEGMPAPDTYRFGNQEYKMNVRDTQEIPLEWGGKLIIHNCIVGGAIDARFIPAIVKGLMDRMEQGPLTGSYARDVRVCIYDGKMHPVDSNEISFRLAGRNAFSEAFRNANPKILEPVYDVNVMVPADVMGDVMSDLQGRRAIIMGMSSENGFEKIQARVPLKEMSSYSTALQLNHRRTLFIHYEVLVLRTRSPAMFRRSCLRPTPSPTAKNNNSNLDIMEIGDAVGIAYFRLPVRQLSFCSYGIGRENHRRQA